MVKVVAHRGFSGRYPENTEIAFSQALSLNVDMIEFDVHISRDGHPVVIHDAAVDRTTDGSGRVADLTLAEIRRLDAGVRFGEQFRGQRIPTLQATLDRIGGKVRLNVHVKAYAHDRQEVVSSTVRELVRRALLSTAFLASDQESILLARRIEPELEICNLTTQPKETYIARSRAAGCRILQPGNAMVDSAFVAEAHRNGMEVNPFYADDVEEMRRLIVCGVDGILTNYPDVLARICSPSSCPESCSHL